MPLAPPPAPPQPPGGKPPSPPSPGGQREEPPEPRRPSLALPGGAVTLVQRQVDGGAAFPVGSVSQPDIGTLDEDSEAAEAADEDSREKKADLARLAQEIYPIVKRMLTVERERRGW